MVVVRWGAGVVSLKNTQYGNYIIASCPNKQSKREQEWIEKKIEWTNVPKFSAPSFFPISSPFFTCAAAWANAWASGFDAAPFMYLLIKYIQKSFNLKFIECNPNCNLVVGCFASFMQKNLKILVWAPSHHKDSSVSCRGSQSCIRHSLFAHISDISLKIPLFLA